MELVERELSTELQKLSLEVLMGVYVYGIPAKRLPLLVSSQVKKNQSSLTAGQLHLVTALIQKKDV
jgi:hypothetical protein